MSSDERGPSWYDAGIAVRELIKEWNVCVEVAILPNWSLTDGTYHGTWCVAVRVRSRSESQRLLHGAQCTFGKAAERKTAPSAILVCTARLWAHLDEAKRLAESQASF